MQDSVRNVTVGCREGPSLVKNRRADTDHTPPSAPAAITLAMSPERAS